MPETLRLDALLKLQSIDIRIAEMIERQEQIPVRRAEMARDITALEQEKTALEGVIERARLDRRSHESELETQQKQREKYEAQLNEVKTNVAYSALLTEIQGAKRRISDLENEILGLMERREESEKRLGEIETELGQKREETADALDELDAEAAEVAKDLEMANSRREEARDGIDPNLYRVYDRLRRARRFPALVPVRGQACGACHGHLPPQVVREVRHDGTIHVCEACGRLVYGDDQA